MKISKPKTELEMMQVIYTEQWLSNAIPYCAVLKDRIQETVGIKKNISTRELKERNSDVIWTNELMTYGNISMI